MRLQLLLNHHETAVQSLILVQEIEPKTWEKISARIEGANTIKHLKTNSFRCPTKLPPMFISWEEYAIYLANNIIQEQKYKDLWFNQVNKFKDLYSKPLIVDDFYKIMIKTIMSSDWDLTKFSNWKISGHVDTYRRYHKTGKWLRNMFKSTKYLNNEEKQILINHFNKLDNVQPTT